MALPIRNSRIRLTQGQLFCREVGEGRPIVFLHGSWQDSDQWIPVMDQLSATYHCLAPDLLGCGESDRPAVYQSIELQVECLADYLATLRLNPVVLVGHEVGGWIAASYALSHPHQVSALVLIGAEGVTWEGMADRWRSDRWLTQRPPLLYWLLKLWLPIAKLLGKQQPIYSLLARRKQLQRSPTICQLLFNRRASELQAEYLNERLSWLKPPVLVIKGETDSPTTIALNQVYAQAPDAWVEQVPGAAAVLDQHPEPLAQAIHTFVERVATP